MSVGDKIKSFRKEKKLTQKRLGELCGIDEAIIRKYESGRVIPKIVTLKTIASALEIDTFLLLDTKSHDNPFLSAIYGNSYNEIVALADACDMNIFHFMGEAFLLGIEQLTAKITGNELEPSNPIFNELKKLNESHTRKNLETHKIESSDSNTNYSPYTPTIV
ncbi:MAG: helix-turn-helix domain-containing protein [Defluviitaleaceae bacterium]|nr:helix-turn-helix domain-containing protein [Defluviitaleaceae bacterium]